MHSDDIINTAEAAKLAGKSPATIRRWAGKGLIPSTKGPPPARGGVSPLMFRRGDVLGFLAESPIPSEPDLSQSVIEKSEPSNTVADLHLVEMEAAELRGKLAESEVRVEVARVTAEFEGSQAALATALMNLAEIKEDRKALREVVAAQRAELIALRSRMSRTWIDVVLGRDARTPALLSGPSTEETS